MAEFYIACTNIVSEGAVFLANLMKNERFYAVAVVQMIDRRDEKACNETCKVVFGLRGANIS